MLRCTGEEILGRELVNGCGKDDEKEGYAGEEEGGRTIRPFSLLPPTTAVDEYKG